MIAALWVLAIALPAAVGTLVIDASLGRIEGWLVRFFSVAFEQRPTGPRPVRVRTAPEPWIAR